MADEWSRVTNEAGQTFVYADEGEGPLVVLLHGFPDTPHGWQPTANALAGAGYRAVRPWLRGYHPETVVAGRRCGAIEIADDAIALLDALGEQRALLVGHDWGALIAYGAASLHPERLIGIVPIAIPHPSLFERSLQLAWAARHFIVNKMPWAERLTRHNDFAYLDTLYRRWAPAWHGAERDACLNEAERCFADPRCLHGALGYYRDIELTPPPEVAKAPQINGLVVGGTTDSPRELYEQTARLMGNGSEALICDGAGHWPHRERESEFIDGLIAYADSHRP